MSASAGGVITADSCQNTSIPRKPAPSTASRRPQVTSRLAHKGQEARNWSETVRKTAKSDPLHGLSQFSAHRHTRAHMQPRQVLDEETETKKKRERERWRKEQMHGSQAVGTPCHWHFLQVHPVPGDRDTQRCPSSQHHPGDTKLQPRDSRGLVQSENTRALVQKLRIS